jgi:hypothetical protein
MKNTRVDRLVNDPLFFYTTLRNSVEQLDGLKATFQYLLAAYELSMDPEIRTQYEVNKQQERTEKLQQLGKTTPVEPSGVPDFAQLRDKLAIAKPFPAVHSPGAATAIQVKEQVIELGSMSIPVEQTPFLVQKVITGPAVAPAAIPPVRKSGMPPDVHSDRVPQGIRGLSKPTPQTDASGPAAFVEAVQTRTSNAAVTSLVEAAASSLTEQALLEVQRAGAQSRVAQEVNKVLKDNDIHLSDKQLVDYMQKKISREDLERIAVRVRNERAVEANAETAAPAAIIASEFSLDQVGQTQSMVYGEHGLLSGILGANLHRYGKGNIHEADAMVKVVELFAAEYPPTLHYTGPNASGIYQTGDTFGIMVMLDRTEKHRDRYAVWIPLHSAQTSWPPMIHAECNPANEMRHVDPVTVAFSLTALSMLDSERVSDITNKLIHYLVKWAALLRSRTTDEANAAGGVTVTPLNAQTRTKSPQVELPGFSLLQLSGGHYNVSEAASRFGELTVISDSHEYTESRQLHDLQHLVYDEGGLLANLLSPQLYCFGKGPIDQVVRIGAEDFHQPTKQQPDNATGFVLRSTPGTGVYHTEGNQLGVLVFIDSGAQVWLPLRLNAHDPMPSIYISTAEQQKYFSLFVNLCKHPDDVIAKESAILISFLTNWLRSLK